MGSRSSNDIRERRYDRIRRVQEGDTGYLKLPDERIGRRENRELPEQLDPETEWNRKWERDWHEYRRTADDPPRESFPSKGRIRTHLVLSGLLFASVWGMYQVDHPLADQGRSYVRTALTHSMDLNGLAAWYDQAFGGSPSFLPAINPLKHQEAQKVGFSTKYYFPPLQGKVLTGYRDDRTGILLEAEAGKPVSAMDKGVVVYAGMRDESGYTVILQHSGNMKSIYGHLEPGTVQVNDWIKGGETVGVVAKSSNAPATLYFAVSKSDKPMNPADVVTFDS